MVQPSAHHVCNVSSIRLKSKQQFTLLTARHNLDTLRRMKA
jgi:hypothetical protein